MGYLKDTGLTFTYEESKQYQDKIKKDGIIQFLNITKKYLKHTSVQLQKEIDPRPYESNKNVVYWGDEIESHIVQLDHQKKTVKIQPNTQYIFKHFRDFSNQYNFEVHPEYGAWMIETTPKTAYHTICKFISIYNNMKERKQAIRGILKENEYILQTPNFFMLGHPDQNFFADLQKQEYGLDSPKNIEQVKKIQQFINSQESLPEENSDQDQTHDSSSHQEEELKSNEEQIMNEKTQSQFIDERLINHHPRFPTLAENIRMRRGEKVKILVPLFKDINTKFDATLNEPYPGYIYMDAMGFGMGQCCLQTTFSVLDLDHARYVYDQLAVLAPIFLALTAGSPIFKGQLADIDTRWQVIEDSVDCRNQEERDPSNPKYIPKSRYSSISYFISNNKRFKECYNNVKFPLNQEIMDFANEEGKKRGLDLDNNLLRHLGFLYVRDALVIYKDKIDVDNEQNTAHFENIQSTNWNSVRLKAPPSFDSQIGWRVEFRVMELQLTEDDNAAFAIFSHIFVRLLYEQWFNINFYIPMDKVDENFKRAAKPNAILTQKFYFRTNILDDDDKPVIQEMTLDEIFFGCKKFEYIGIREACKQFAQKWIERLKVQCFQCCYSAELIWDFIKNRTTGKIKTLATWIREFVLNHPDYKKDSLVNNNIAYDLTKKMIDISYNNIKDPNFPDYFQQIITKMENKKTDGHN